MIDWPNTTQRTDDTEHTPEENLYKKIGSKYLHNAGGHAVAWVSQDEEDYYGSGGIIWDEYAEATMLPEDQWSVNDQKSIDELKKNINIREALKKADIPFKDTGKRLRFNCPFHDDRSPSCDYWPEINGFRCWACGAKGDSIDLYWGISNANK